MKSIVPVVIGCLLVSGAAFAHSDRILRVSGNGALEGLPSAYAPAMLHVAFAASEADGAPVKSIDLALGKSQVHLPVCVTGLLLTRQMSEIRVSASWYHDETLLPYYLHVDFFDPGRSESHWANPGYSLLFNLHTGKLMKMEVNIVRDNGNSVQSVPVDLAARCKPDEFRSFISDVR